MIVFDTNVVSELLRREPDRLVLSWASGLTGPVGLTSITAWELRYGVSRLPEGRRRTQLAGAVERVLHEAAGGILPFDDNAARAAARMRVARDRAGRPVATADLQIAGICESRRAVLATRNVKDFEGLGLELIDPWTC